MQSAARRISSSLIPRPRLRVFVRESDAVVGSKRRWFAASVSSEEPLDEPKRQGRRVLKQERRGMLKSFVDRYRALNAGKFPSVSHAQKEVGGSYYIVREIIQELEYNHRTSGKSEKPTYARSKIDVSTDTVEISVKKDVVTVRAEVEEPIFSTDSGNGNVEETVRHSVIDIIHPSEQTVEGSIVSTVIKQISSIGTSADIVESPCVKDNVTDGSLEVHDSKETEEGSPSRCADENTKDNAQDATQFQDDFSIHVKLEAEADSENTPLNDTQGTIGDKGTTSHAEEEARKKRDGEISKSAELSGEKSMIYEDASSKEPSIWENFRTLADGFIKFWKGK